MGGDFLLAQAELPRDTNNHLILGPVVAEIIKQWIIDLPEPLEEAYTHEEGLGDDNAWVVNSAMKVVDYWIGQEQALHDRTVDIRVFGDVPYLFTGGVTWGDPPSDSWDEIIMLSWIADLYYTDARFPAPGIQYEVGIMMRFTADDAEHAMEQFVDAVQGAEILGAINHIEVISNDEEE